MIVKECPFHTGVSAEIMEVCRRCDEFKTNESKTWEAIDDMKGECKTFREDCRKELNEEISARPMTGTLLMIMSIVLAALSTIGGYFLYVHARTLDSLVAKDAAIEATVRDAQATEARERKEIAREVSDTKEIVIELRTMMKAANKKTPGPW